MKLISRDIINELINIKLCIGDEKLDVRDYQIIIESRNVVKVIIKTKVTKEALKILCDTEELEEGFIPSDYIFFDGNKKLNSVLNKRITIEYNNIVDLDGIRDFKLISNLYEPLYLEVTALVDHKFAQYAFLRKDAVYNG